MPDGSVFGSAIFWASRSRFKSFRTGQGAKATMFIPIYAKKKESVPNTFISGGGSLDSRDDGVNNTPKMSTTAGDINMT